MISSPPYRYIILGTGRQGSAAAYDLVLFGEAEMITLADIQLEAAQKAAERINHLVQRDRQAHLFGCQRYS